MLPSVSDCITRPLEYSGPKCLSFGVIFENAIFMSSCDITHAQTTCMFSPVGIQWQKGQITDN